MSRLARRRCGCRQINYVGSRIRAAFVTSLARANRSEVSWPQPRRKMLGFDAHGYISPRLAALARSCCERNGFACFASGDFHRSALQPSFASSRRSTSIGGPCGRMIWLATRTLAASARLPVTLKLSPPDSSTANLRWRRPVSSKHGEQRGRRGRASSSCAPPPISPACAWRRASCVGARGAVAGLCINPSRSRSSRFDRRENAP